MREHPRQIWAAVPAALLNVVASFLMIAMVVVTLVDVTLRYFFNMPIFGSTEMVSFGLLLSIFAGLALVAERNEHISVSLLEKLWNRISPTAYLTVRRVANIVGMLFVALLLYRQAETTLATGQTSVLLGWPYFPAVAATIVFVMVGVILAVAAIVRGDSEHTGGAD